MFAQPVPGLSIKGEETVKTKFGAFCSIIISIIVLYYTLIKSIQLFQRQNATIKTFDVEKRFDADNPIDLADIDFRAAFQF